MRILGSYPRQLVRSPSVVSEATAWLVLVQEGDASRSVHASGSTLNLQTRRSSVGTYFLFLRTHSFSTGELCNRKLQLIRNTLRPLRDYHRFQDGSCFHRTCCPVIELIVSRFNFAASEVQKIRNCDAWMVPVMGSDRILRALCSEADSVGQEDVKIKDNSSRLATTCWSA